MDIQEFQANVLPVKNKLFRLAYVLLSNKEEAEDVLQDVLLKLWMERHKLHTYKSIEAFAMVIVKNLCLNLLKKKNRRAIIYPEPGALESKAATSDHPYEQADQARRLSALLRRLPESQRMVIQLRDVEGYPFEEVVLITGFSLNHVRVLLSRARTALRKEFQKLENYGNA